MDEIVPDATVPTPAGTPAARTDSTIQPPPVGRASGYPERSVLAYTTARERFLALHAKIISHPTEKD